MRYVSSSAANFFFHPIATHPSELCCIFLCIFSIKDIQTRQTNRLCALNDRSVRTKSISACSCFDTIDSTCCAATAMTTHFVRAALFLGQHACLNIMKELDQRFFSRPFSRKGIFSLHRWHHVRTCACSYSVMTCGNLGSPTACEWRWRCLFGKQQHYFRNADTQISSELKWRAFPPTFSEHACSRRRTDGIKIYLTRHAWFGINRPTQYYHPIYHPIRDLSGNMNKHPIMMHNHVVANLGQALHDPECSRRATYCVSGCTTQIKY